MLKKILAILTVLLMFATFCGCNSEKAQDKKAKDTKETVNGEELSFNDIMKKTDGDAMSFYSNYAERKVEITGTVEKIEKGSYTLMSRSVSVWKVYLKEGWLAYLLVSDDAKHIEQIKAGDTVTIKSAMSKYDSSVGYIEMEDISLSGTGSNTTYRDDSTIVKK